MVSKFGIRDDAYKYVFLRVSTQYGLQAFESWKEGFTLGEEFNPAWWELQAIYYFTTKTNKHDNYF